MIDEFPVLFIAAAVANGRTVVRGAAELRVKESDRIASMATGLRALGVAIEETPDGAIIEGGALGGGTVESHRRPPHRDELRRGRAGRRPAPVRISDCGQRRHLVPRLPGAGQRLRLCRAARLAD